MTLSQRERRDWRLILRLSVYSALVSAVFAWRVAPDSDPPLHRALTGVATSLVVATPILLVQIKGDHATRWLTRLPFAAQFAIKAAFFSIVILGGLALSRELFSTGGFQLDLLFRRSIIFSVAMAVGANLVVDVGGLLGFGTLKALLTGRYVRPRREERVFLLIDLKNSTGVAERLGPIRYHELINAFFHDISEAALECGAEIHKYVGDEAILTWVDAGATTDNQCLTCPFLVRDLTEAKANDYLKRFGLVPEFRAALHRGEIVAGEVGDVRREIAYVGDTLNVTARLLEAAKTTGRDVLVSDDLLQRTTVPADLRAEKLPMLNVRGREAPLSIAALERVRV